MIARISTTLNADETDLWEKIIQPASLEYVASPLLTFKPIDGSSFENGWVTDRVYKFRIYLFNFIPMGKHIIELKEINRRKNIIRSQEAGLIASVWNHTITFNNVGENKIRYTDEVEIRAGFFTPFVWLFAHFFYRHRQRRWEKLLAG